MGNNTVEAFAIPIPVSVVITNYRNGKFIIDAIKSVVDQSYKMISDIVIVDDASGDGSVDIIKDFISKPENLKGRTVKFIQHEKNGGVSEARNTGIMNSIGTIIAFLDGDDFYYKDKIAVSVGKMMEYPTIGVVYSDYDQINENTGNKRREFKAPFDMSVLISQYCMVATNSVVKRDVFEKVGLYKTNLRIMEDYEFWMRASTKFSFVHIPVNLWCRRDHDDCITLKTPSKEWAETERKMRQEFLASIGINTGSKP